MRMPKKPPNVTKQSISGEKLEIFFRKWTSSNPYLHWDELLRRKPPEGLSHKDIWHALKIGRRMQYKLVPLKDTQGEFFQYVLTDQVLELLNYIDVRAGNRLEGIAPIATEEQQDRYYISSTIEEATASSKLEGAMMTRPQAKEMLRSGRKPVTKSERMIVNNFATMRKIDSIKNEPLTPELICELQSIITEGTLDDPSCAGRLRKTGENVDVVDTITHEVAHVPPPAEELEQRMLRMCLFANEKAFAGQYFSPVLKAVILHFWLAYDHPFVDGNGRTARALFYWAMLHNEYTLFRFLSISSIILQSPAQYARAYLHTETDDNDLTYFILYHLKTIKRSVEQLEKYVEHKTRELVSINQKLRGVTHLNHRQKALLTNALSHPFQRYTFESHSRSQNIVRQTARTDILGLVELGFLDSLPEEGRQRVFRPAEDLSAKLADMRK